MTLFTSDNSKIAWKIFFRYLIVSGFCFLFGLIYEHFSHEVWSASMALMFLFPLLGGAVPLALLALTKWPYLPGGLDRTLYGCGIATLTVGSCFKGVLDIYGTTSSLTAVYLIAGLILILAGLAVYFVSLLFVRKLQH